MKKKILTILILSSAGFAFAQVGINTQKPAATLDIVAPKNTTQPDGAILPRLTGDELKAKDNLYSTGQKGTLVYVTAPVTSSSLKTFYVTSEGYYYFDGNRWQQLNSSSLPGSNIYTADGYLRDSRTVTMGTNTLSFKSAATTGTSHFNVAGNTLNVDANNLRIGIGTNAPAAKLHVVGNKTVNLATTDPSPVKVGGMPPGPANGAGNKYVTVDASGDLRQGQNAIPFIYQKYIFKNTYYDWVDGYDTLIPTDKYTVLIMGFSFNNLLYTDRGTNNNNANRDYFGPTNIVANADPTTKTWKISADYKGSVSNETANNEWTIYTLILDKSQIIQNADLSPDLQTCTQNTSVYTPASTTNASQCPTIMKASTPPANINP
ncbi:hypothetical protein [Chryseobacterium sp.]|uniref:hypothetical protein n=1 Tax=Chryseobacterium sp. TaxID=1871047 RepID=UPI0025BA4B4C|nr:hypothetical protein [Chryseobacterium sp.]MBV8325158.1 hypothetical protein [Chryseobacterium sp.]